MNYDRHNPYLASIKERYSLTKPGSKKETLHVVIDLADSGITYEVGDSIGVYPTNPPEMVKKTLEAMKVTGDEIVTEKRSGEEWQLKEFLTKKANLALVSKKLFNVVYEKQGKEAPTLSKDELKKYLEEREIWDFLLENEEVQFSPNELCQLMMPLLPRLYSIASSQKVVGNEVHLTVASLNYVTNSQKRLGVCTHYLCHLAPLNERVVPVYLQPHKGFTLPSHCDVPIIMIGPGTGIAPYRGFMQERLLKGGEKNWLFFGEWNRATDFFYEEYWKDLTEKKKLIVNAAFSRDQKNKVYVQHLMLEKGEELFRWLQDGAYIYVCGDAEKMAKDVEAAIHRIVERHGKLSEDEAKAYVKQMRKEKRYLRDVY